MKDLREVFTTLLVLVGYLGSFTHKMSTSTVTNLSHLKMIHSSKRVSPLSI